MSRIPQARAIAARILASVLEEGQTLTALLPHELAKLRDRRDQALAQELCYGVTRYYFRLEFLLQQLLERELKSRDADIKALILIGLHQLINMRTPPHAAVAATVGASQELGKPWATGLVNAILRRYQRESDRLLKAINTNDIAKYNHPKWLLDLLQQEYPDDWHNLVVANDRHPPMCLRINHQKTRRNDYLEMLIQRGIKARICPHTETGLILEHAIDVEQLPGFPQGLISIQDLAAQLTPTLMELRPSLRVLDACASPGGKLAHIMETEPELEVTGIEVDPQRMQRLQQNLQRLDLKPVLHRADARYPDTWWDGTLYDRILLDAPCSATGVIRRHPDIKLLRTPDEIDTAARLQGELLQALWPLLKSGGKLLYVTCSVLSCENDQQIGRFINDHHDAHVQPITANWGKSLNHGRQILPGTDDMDGFYYALLCKS